MSIEMMKVICMLSVILMWIAIVLNVWCIVRNRKFGKMWRDKYVECMVYLDYLRYIASKHLSDEAYEELERLMEND